MKKRFSDHTGEFKAYAISVPDLKFLDLNWKGANLFVQNMAIKTRLQTDMKLRPMTAVFLSV